MMTMYQADSIRQEKRSLVPRAVSRGALWILRNWIMALVLFFIFMWTFMPILWTLTMSFKGVKELYSMPTRLLPHEPSLGNYRWMFEYLPKLPIYFKNSVITTLGAVGVRTFCAALMGYAFARLDFKGRDLIFYSMIVAMFVPRAGGLMARYELMHSLHLRNSLFGLMLLFASNLSVPLFIMRQNFLSMPTEIEDAARIDGAGRWRLFLEIAIPFAASGMLVVAILTFVNVWGEYLTTITMIDDQNLYTLGVGLAMFDTGGAEMMQAEADVSEQGIKSAAYLLASIPAILLYITMQKYFVKGLTEGAIKF
jgi:ABC-type glycerol-3-phosphate transport system permease component